MEFPQFKPPQSILEQICRDKKEGLVAAYHILLNQTEIPETTNRTMMTMDDMIRMEVNSLIHTVAEFYFWEVELKENMNTHKFAGIVGESLSNAIAHGTKQGDPIVIGIFLGDDGVCLGFYDGGAYFKSEETKRLFENRIIPEQHGRKTCVSGMHCGTSVMFDDADFIAVDTETGILYLAQLKKNLAMNENCMDHREEYLKFLETYKPTTDS